MGNRSRKKITGCDDLPPETVVDILSRLPNESLQQCKLVCKTWLNLMVYDPSFTRMHIERRIHDHDSSGEMSFIFVMQDDIGFKKFYYAEYGSKYENLMKVADMDITHTFDSNFFSSSGSITLYQIVGSCNGLICVALYVFSDLGVYYVYRMYIFNPMTRECLVLPQLDNGPYNYLDDKHYSYYGFGYIPSTNDYKIIGFIYGEKTGDYTAYVYTLGSGNGWRNIGSINSTFHRARNSESSSFSTVLLNGALNWVDMDGNIMSFDLADEILQSLPLAPCFEDWLPEDYSSSYELRVLGECLCIVKDNGDDLYEFWLLKNKKKEGEHNAGCDKKKQGYQSWSWTHEFTLDWSLFCSNEWGIGRPISLTNDSEMLLHNGRAFYLHDLEDETSYTLVDFYKRDGMVLINSKEMYPIGEHPPLYGTILTLEAILHVNSFVSLKALGEKDTVMMESNEAPELKSIVPELNYRRGEMKRNMSN